MEMAADLPDDFKCPISLDIMSDPVILPSGQTFDRNSIQRWLDSGHRTCPITKLRLPNHPSLIPNYALRSLISTYAPASAPKLQRQPRREPQSQLPSKICRCGLMTKIKVSSTAKNPGRLFFGCPRFVNRENRGCGFQGWVDKEVEVEASPVLVEEKEAEIAKQREEIKLLQCRVKLLGKMLFIALGFGLYLILWFC